MGNNMFMDNYFFNKSKIYNQCKSLPNNPGVYIMKNSENETIYIGKAKNLKNRVSSYFMKNSGHNGKVKKMVENVDHFEYIITESEFEALVLECSLIKKYQPKYNILLKDDKGYSYIKIENEKWPKIKYVKQKNNDGATYIGPYVNLGAVKKLTDEANKIFKLPTCNRNLIKKYQRPCLNYYINICCAPCIRAVAYEEYRDLIKKAIFFLQKGAHKTVEHLKKEMIIASNNLNFELAAKIRDKIKALEIMRSKQKVVSIQEKNQDVISLAQDNENVSCEVFKFRNGDLYGSKNFIFEIQDSIILSRTEFLKQYYLSNDIPNTILLDGEIENHELIEKFLSDKKGEEVRLILGSKKEEIKLIDMCKENAYENLLRESKPKNNIDICLQDLKNLLSLDRIPRYIEAYDVSNLYGSDNVGGMIVFKDGKPFKAMYRKFKISTFSGQDDYSAISEILKRRLKYFIDNKNNGNQAFENLPDLILIDGGKTHTAAAKNVLKGMGLDIPVFGMVKDRKHRTKAITNEGNEIEIKSNRRVFAFITSIQDEVHRFALNYHKSLRSKKIKESDLTQIKYVGKVRSKNLLKAFGSIQKISQASIEEISRVDGITLKCAEEIHNYFHS